MIVQGPVEEEKAVAVAGAKLQGSGTWPVVGAGALAKAGGEEGPSSSMSISTHPGSRTAELAGARAEAEARAFSSKANVVIPVGARARARAWTGAVAGAEARAEAGAFLSEPTVATEEVFFEGT